jgi:hypothetical protein
MVISCLNIIYHMILPWIQILTRTFRLSWKLTKSFWFLQFTENWLVTIQKFIFWEIMKTGKIDDEPEKSIGLLFWIKTSRKPIDKPKKLLNFWKNSSAFDFLFWNFKYWIFNQTGAKPFSMSVRFLSPWILLDTYLEQIVCRQHLLTHLHARMCCHWSMNARFSEATREDFYTFSQQLFMELIC